MPASVLFHTPPPEAATKIVSACWLSTTRSTTRPPTLAGPSSCHGVGPSAGTAAACACARWTCATLTSLAELCLRSRYSSGASGAVVSCSIAGGGAAGAAASCVCGPVVERVVATVPTTSSTVTPAAIRSVRARRLTAVPRRSAACVRRSPNSSVNLS